MRADARRRLWQSRLGAHPGYMVALVLTLVVGALVPALAEADTLGGSSAGMVARESLLTPDELGDGVLDGLQYPDPTEGLALVQTPEANQGGSAQLSYPFVIPPGRGIAPVLALNYDSGGGNGWVGLGWDLSVGEISVDTAFGVPHFDPLYESESYLLDGDVLVPNAVDGAWELRPTGDRQDYTRQQESEYEQIIRHVVGDGGPDDYFWEVRDQGGGIRWYGGHPDAGGPDGGPRSTGETIDRSAIVYDDNGNAVRWLLSAVRDVGVNQIRYHYEKVTYARTTGGWTPQACDVTGGVLCGRHTYLSRIDYTEAAEVAPDPAWDGDAPYQVHLLRESTVNPAAAVRQDPIIDGTGRYVDVVNDRLARLEVRYGDPLPLGAPRTYNQVAARYDLEYVSGPFGKSLLSAVTQVATALDGSARHEFAYNNAVAGIGANYAGFDTTRTEWNTGSDLADRLLLDSNVSIGALGASETNSGEGHAYIGFNLAIPQKVGSFGGSFQIGAGGTEALAEWIDLNGDRLPDKVFRDGNVIRFRLNQSGPDGGLVFADVGLIGGALPRLTREVEVNFQLSVEAYLGVTLAVGLGGAVSIGDSYFTDINADGLPDFVGAGSVWFNRLEGGVPTFLPGSNGTAIPLPVGGGNPTVTVDQVTDLEADLAANSPLVDTVRRWTAPYDGTVRIDALVRFAGVGSVDGVRVAIQHNDTELGAANLINTGLEAFATPISRAVLKGDQLYFRVGSVFDGANDEVQWSPTITYTSPAATPPAAIALDANGLSQTTFSAEGDFTLAGRPNSVAVLPHTGSVRFTTTVTKSRATSDNLKVVLLHNGTPVTVPNATLPAAFVGSRVLSVAFPVAGPTYPTAANPGVIPHQDTVEAYLAVDSAIDLTAIDWHPSLAYLSAQNAAGATIPVTDGAGNPTIVVDLLPEIEQYPNSSATGFLTPYTALTTGTYDLAVTVARPLTAPVGSAVVTAKTSTGALAGKATITLGGGTATYVADLNAPLVDGTKYFFDVSIRGPEVSDSTNLTAAALRPNGGDGSTDLNVPATLRWRGRQTIFPLAYRGWAVAGYTAAGANATAKIDPNAFVVDEARFDGASAPTGFADLDTTAGANVEPAMAFIPRQQLTPLPGAPASTFAGPLWRGQRDNQVVSATRVRSSRLGADSVVIGGGSTLSGAGSAVTRVGIAIPTAALGIGVGPLGGSLGIGPSFGLVDYQDMNGDGYPDVLTPGSIHYTDQRGAFLASKTSVGDLAVINQDLTISAQLGFANKLVDTKPNAKGKTNATQGGAAGKGGDGNDASAGIGLGGDISAAWTSPNASGGGTDPAGTYADELADVPDSSTGGTADIQVALADVNGDGLPDRVFTTPQGVFAQYNLGYRFTSQSFKVTTGGFEAMESYAGSASLGFSTPWAEFAGGVALNFNYDQARYTWRDINGDGILDQVHKRNGDQAPLVAFGTGSGMLAPVEYGSVESVSGTLADNGQQVAFDRANGLGGGIEITVYIGPLCLVACYLVINPGGSYQNTISTTQVDLQDVNGDGYADSVSTTNDDKLTVRLNNHADTNLLKSVKNPLGGTIELSYERDGNTVEHPGSIWALSRVQVDDGRPGDGADRTTTTYEYTGLRYDRVHRQSLGYATIAATELDTTIPAAPPLRATISEYHNDNVFTAGLLTSVTAKTAGGARLHRATSSYGFRDVRDIPVGFDVLAKVTPLDKSLLGSTTTVGSRGRSIAPLVVRTDEQWYEGGALANETFNTFTYDGLGNVLSQTDKGETEDPDDDLVVTYVYSNCAISSTMDPQCMQAVQQPHPSPIFSLLLCPTWVSLPVVIDVTNGKSGPGLVTYRHRDGRGSVCDNASMTHQEETVSDGRIAQTELTYDEWGSYDRIVYPTGSNGKRYAVRYIYDLSRRSNIAEVTEYELDPSSVDTFLEDYSIGPDAVQGLTSTATFDGLAGRISSRTDPNGNTIRYAYDSLARIRSISSPRPSDVAPLVTYEYHPSAAGYGYAKASHFDSFNPGNTIDTLAFVDGIGRTTQTKRDARLFQGAGVVPVEGRSVSGLTRFDALGRPTEQFRPSQDTASASTFLATATNPVEKTDWDLLDRPTKLTKPGPRVTSFLYGFAAPVAGGPTLFSTTITEPNNRATTTYNDVRASTRALDEKPVAFNTLRSSFVSDGMGQLRAVTDRAGNITTHDYDMAGRHIATTTPDAGLVQFGYDDEGKLVSKVTPNLRAAGQDIRYRYQLGRLVSIDYPGTTPDVRYQYGTTGAANNGAGRVILEEDGSRIVTSEYAPSGALSKQVVEMKYHDWFNDPDKTKFRTTTQWSYDGLGRMESMVYPDGESLTYDYDGGGLAQSVVGSEVGLKKVQVGVDAEGKPIYQDVPHTWNYSYLNDQQYDEFLRVRFQELGNRVTTEQTFDTNTLWLSRLQSISPDRNVATPAYFEIQDLSYTYDSVGNPTELRNSLPPAVANQFGGSSVQRYRYDPLERIVGGTGVYDLADKRHQRYELSIAYDGNGNVVAKNQYDATVRSPVDLVNPPGPPGAAKGKNADLVNAKNTFKFDRVYSAAAPHQAVRAGTNTYGSDSTFHYDMNGNLLGMKDARGRYVRQIEWDASDRMTLVTDGPSSTEYRYDDTGQRTIERGPAGETAFVNPWVTTRNKNEMFKHIWVDNTRIATQRDDGPYEELKRYFLHKDLQGSTNMVTDAGGETFQHHEYFPNGDVWIDEKSTQFRTPYQFSGGYVDEVRDIINFGARWYDQNREFFYAADPVLSEDPAALTAKPDLGPAYAYAGSNPLTNIDPSGREFFTAQTSADVKRQHADARAFVGRNPAVAASIVAGLDTRLPRGLVRAALDTKRADRIQSFAKTFDAKPFVEIDPNKGTVKLSLGIGKRIKIPANNAPTPAAAAIGTGNGVAPLAGPGNAAAVGPAVGQGGGAAAAGALNNPAAPVAVVAPVAAADAALAPPRPRSALPPVGGGGAARADE